MGRLFKLKEWLTLPDAAAHLSIAFGEEVSEADILRLALDGRLRLSVYFVNHAKVRKGRLVPMEQCPIYLTVSPGTKHPKYQGEKPFSRLAKNLKHADLAGLGRELLEDIQKRDLLVIYEGIHYRQGEFLLLDEAVISIYGVWDLTMLGQEGLDVEHRYQMETGGPEVTLGSFDGAFVERGGEICQLQERWENNEYQPGSEASRERLEAHIEERKIGEEEAAKLRAGHDEQRKEFLQRQKDRPYSEQFYPAGGLPEDAVYVVRTAALRELEQSAMNEGAPATVSTSERETLQKQIAALALVVAERGEKYRRGGKPNASQIANLAREIAESIPGGNLRGVSPDHLREAIAAGLKLLADS